MAKRPRHKKGGSHSEERRLTVRGIRRDPPDIKKLSRALIGLAMAEAERQAQAEQVAKTTTPAKPADTSGVQPSADGGGDE